MPGDIRKGMVKNITDFGAFIDLNGLDGLLHITDMSWGRIGHPSEMLKVGQELDVVVLDVNKEKERVSLGLKQKLANPWDNIETKYPVGQQGQGQGRQPRALRRVRRARTRRRRPGARHRALLDQAHRQALRRAQAGPGSRGGRARHQQGRAEDLASASASSKPTRGTLAEQKYPIGSKVKGKVRNLTSYGAFVELEEGIDGMIHVSDMSWTRKINHPSEVLKKGDEVEAVVLEVDKPNQRIALGIKQLAEDPWENIDKYYKVGDLVTGKVTKLASFGAFIGLQHDIDGLVHISQVSEDRVDKIKNVLKVGQDVTARVIKIDQRRAPHRPVHQGRQLQRRAAQGRAEAARRAQAGRRPRGPAARLRRRRGNRSSRTTSRRTEAHRNSISTRQAGRKRSACFSWSDFKPEELRRSVARDV